MLILTLRTDKPESEIGLYEDDQRVAYEKWEAHRQLAETIHKKVKELLNAHDQDWTAIQGIVAYEGPGSFTGLRIGLSVANALAESGAKIVGVSGDQWIADGIARLLQGQDDQRVPPAYGADVHITPPKQ